MANSEVRVSVVLLVVEQNRVFVGKAGDDVDVPASAKLVVIAGQTAADPNRLGCSEFGVQFCLDFFATPLGVATLASLDSLGQQDSTLAVYMDAATFVD